MLVLGDRRRRHAAAARAGGVQRQRAPARADLQQVVGRLQVELVVDQLELGHRGLLERHPGLARTARRSTSSTGRASARRGRRRGRSGPRCPCAQRRGVLRTNAWRARRYGSRTGASRRRAASSRLTLRAATRSTAVRSGRVPQPLRVGLGEPAAAVQQVRPQRGREDLHRRRGGARAELVADAVLDDGQAALADLPEQAERDAAGDGSPHAATSGRRCHGTPFSLQRDGVRVDQRDRRAASRRSGAPGRGGSAACARG